VDDPVGAISVHGTNGLWGVISVGLFADGTNGGVTGLFYSGGAGQLVAQLIGVSTLLGFVFTLSYVVNVVIDLVVGQRVPAEDELEGLDFPEMGALCYPEFVLKPQATPVGAAAAD
jgi:Amt family ammonium transporter